MTTIEQQKGNFTRFFFLSLEGLIDMFFGTRIGNNFVSTPYFTLHIQSIERRVVTRAHLTTTRTSGGFQNIVVDVNACGHGKEHLLHEISWQRDGVLQIHVVDRREGMHVGMHQLTIDIVEFSDAMNVFLRYGWVAAFGAYTVRKFGAAFGIIVLWSDFGVRLAAASAAPSFRLHCHKRVGSNLFDGLTILCVHLQNFPY